jgi:tRNA(Ile2) C34 agmatinyltransferase TiaS
VKAVDQNLFLLDDSLVTEEIRSINMAYCPECGGEMQYMIGTKHYVCKSCGLSVTQQELDELREKNRPNFDSDETEQEKRRKEYLKWWLSKKK